MCHLILEIVNHPWTLISVQTINEIHILNGDLKALHAEPQTWINTLSTAIYENLRCGIRKCAYVLKIIGKSHPWIEKQEKRWKHFNYLCINFDVLTMTIHFSGFLSSFGLWWVATLMQINNTLKQKIGSQLSVRFRTTVSAKNWKTNVVIFAGFSFQ